MPKPIFKPKCRSTNSAPGMLHVQFKPEELVLIRTAIADKNISQGEFIRQCVAFAIAHMSEG